MAGGGAVEDAVGEGGGARLGYVGPAWRYRPVWDAKRTATRLTPEASGLVAVRGKEVD